MLGAAGHLVAAPALEPSLVPAPRRMARQPGEFRLSEDAVVQAASPALGEALALAAALRAVTAFPLPIESGETDKPILRLVIGPQWEQSLGTEGYRLTVERERVEIQAAAPAGLFYGGMTFQQLLPAAAWDERTASPSAPKNWVVPCLVIEDTPQYPWRGLLLDVARHYMPPEFLRRMVDLMALHKFNTLQLHLTDDQGWRLPVPGLPRLTEIGARRNESPRPGDRERGDGTPYGPFYYTSDEIRALVAYAARRHVTIVPEIEMPGHFLGALAAYPEYSCRGGPFQVRTRWGIEEDILCVGNDASLALVETILSEVTALFPGKFIHIGGDEAPRTRWKECPRCQARMRSEGLREEAELQAWFNRRVARFLASKGRRLIGWDEILEGGLPPDATVMSWRGMQGGTAAAKLGHDVVMSPTSHCYLDYGQSTKPGEPECIGGVISLKTVYEFTPVPPALSHDQRRHILGVQGNLWTEYLRAPREVEYFAFPRACALAEVAWSAPEGRSYDDFLQRLKHHLARLDQFKVNYRRPD